MLSLSKHCHTELPACQPARPWWVKTLSCWACRNIVMLSLSKHKSNNLNDSQVKEVAKLDQTLQLFEILNQPFDPSTSSGQAKLRVTSSGWQYPGFVMLNCLASGVLASKASLRSRKLGRSNLISAVLSRDYFGRFPPRHLAQSLKMYPIHFPYALSRNDDLGIAQYILSRHCDKSPKDTKECHAELVEAFNPLNLAKTNNIFNGWAVLGSAPL